MEKMFKGRILKILILAICVTILPNTLSGDEGDGVAESKEADMGELTRATQNPVANLISVPIQNNTNFDYGPLDKTQNITNIQPVIPFQLNEDWNLITRTIAPLMYQPEFVKGQDSEYGLSDIQLALFFSPIKPSKFIWGAGPVILMDTASDDRLGTGKWSAGPSAVGLTMRGPWVIGALIQNVWSFTGDSDRSSVNQMLIQYFINYNFANGIYFTSAPIITANWKADGGEKWTIPFGGGFGKLFRIGKLPVNTSISAYYNVEKPDILGPRWQLRCQVQFLFPK